MKETGIIMSSNHPKLILDGIKTMTRRTWGLDFINEIPNLWHCLGNDGDLWYFQAGSSSAITIKCPYGQVGDRLWVRETWAVNPTMDSVSPHDISSVAFVYYKASARGSPLLIGRWRPSIFMPHWASRIDRIITLLRVERLRDITEADAQAEGGYSVEEFIKMFLRLNHLPEDANPWDWVIGW